MDLLQPKKKYQMGDRDNIDYQYEVLDGCSFAVRGPLSADGSKAKIVCLGSAATFGRFVTTPYSVHLAAKLNAHVANCGFGGARFETYLKERSIVDLCRQSRLVILELMSARSYASDVFTPRDHLSQHGKIGPAFAPRIADADARSRLLEHDVTANACYKWAVDNLDPDELTRIRTQLLERYVGDAFTLISEIGRPTVLFWFSQRSMDEVSDVRGYRSWTLGFPHFVDRPTVSEISSRSVGLVEVTSATGIPSKLPSLESNHSSPSLQTKRSIRMSQRLNRYYPSPEMHVEASQALAKVIQPLL